MPNLYRDTADSVAPAPPHSGDARVDVVVVGAGFTGLSAALHVAERGLSVMAIDAHEPGWGASGRNGGQVNAGLKFDPDVVERRFGADLGGRMNALAGRAPDLVFDLIERHRIDCDPRRNGTLRAASHDRPAVAIRSTVEQWTRRGAPVQFLTSDAIERLTGTARYRAAMLDRRGGDLHPLKFARGLARAAQSAGARLHGGTRAIGLERAGAEWIVMTETASGADTGTDTGAVKAAHVVLATNGYTDDLWPGLRRSVVPVYGSIAATEPLPEALARAVMPSRSVLYESGAITVYYRVDVEGRLLIGGRGPQSEITSTAALEHLLVYAVKLWPGLRGVRWTHAWGGRLAMTRDHYPHVHEPAPGLIACLGYNGRGVAMATAMGEQIARRICDPSGAFDMPLTAVKPIRFHAAWPLAVRAAIVRGRLVDFLGL